MSYYTAEQRIEMLQREIDALDKELTAARKEMEPLDKELSELMDREGILSDDEVIRAHRLEDEVADMDEAIIQLGFKLEELQAERDQIEHDEHVKDLDRDRLL